jgi:hypothetical protein
MKYELIDLEIPAKYATKYMLRFINWYLYKRDKQ